MPTATYEPIATTTLGGSSSSITFSSIPVTFSDIRLVLTGTASANVTCCLRINSNSGNIYSNVNIRAANTSIVVGAGASALNTFQFLGGNSSLSTVHPTMYTIDFIHYLGTNGPKSYIYTISADKNTNTTSSVERAVGTVNTTSAVSSITIFPNGANWNSGTTATLYGIKRA